MSYAEKSKNFNSGNVQPFQNEFIPLKKEERPQTQFYFRLSRYVNEKIKRIRSYRTFLVSLKPTEPITNLLNEKEVSNNIYVKIHIPQTHTLNKTNYTLTLEDLSHRLSKMKIKFPLCVYSSENNPAARLNYQQAMAGSIDGKDYILFVFVAKSELQSYKRRWPNQVLVELPFETKQDNWKDVTRQTIKIFGETLGIDYVFMLEDNIYCSYKSNEGKWEPISMLDYFQALQEAAIQSHAPLVGSRVTLLGNLNVPVKQNEWDNSVVQSAYLVKTSGLKEYFGKSLNNNGGDQGLTNFNKSCNEVGVVQQSQKYLLQCGYSIDDPVIEGVEFRKPEYYDVKSLEPELSGLNLKVKLVSLEKVVDQKLSDGSRYARALGIIADNTGSIVFVAKNDQVDLVQGQNYSIRNAKITMFKGWMRLELDEWGKVEPLNEEIQPKTSLNLSKTEYELVDDHKDRDE
jgi:replication factor A1